MSNEYKDWLADQEWENNDIITAVRAAGYTPLTDKGIIELYNSYCDNTFSLATTEEFTVWLHQIGLHGHTCKYCRFACHDLTNDVYLCYNTEFNLTSSNRGNFSCSKWEEL